MDNNSWEESRRAVTIVNKNTVADMKKYLEFFPDDAIIWLEGKGSIKEMSFEADQSKPRLLIFK